VGSVAPSGTVTFLFTDIEGSTRLWDQHPDEMRAALEAHDALLLDAVEAADGYVFATGGDGFCVAFERASGALDAVLVAQKALRDFSWPQGAALKVRMALHTGEAVERDGDYFGPSVNRAARLLTVAGGDQIVVSAATASLIFDRLAPGVRLIDAGTFTLRGLERSDHLFQLVPPGAEALPLSAPAISGNLPGSLTTYVGQSTEMKRLADDLPRRRLITLTGVGGVGKTRMALEAAWAAHDEFSGGVWLVELAPIADADGVTHAVASVLRVEPYPGMTLEDAIIDALQGRRLLLIVDNCEHVLDATNRLIGRIVSSCPTVTILATSREPLGVVGERVVGVRSLDPELEAVELFCELAEAADSDFSVFPADVEAIGRVCRRLDGIPLAVELAAARTRTMSLGELERRLADRFRLLRGAGRGRVERHQTLRATVAWSHQLLSPIEQAVFDRCAVFAGSFDERAVEAMCSGDTMDRAEIADVVSALVDKSMLVADRRRGDTRYRLLETLRQYGEEQLGADLDEYRSRHLHHYVTVAEELDRRLQGRDLGGGIAGFRVEMDNLRAAVQWAVATRDPMSEALVRATITFARVAMASECEGWYEQVLDSLEEPSPYLYGVLAWLVNSSSAAYDRAAELARAGLANASGPDDPTTADCWAALASSDSFTGRYDEAVVEGFERSVPLYVAAGNRVHAAIALSVLATVEQNPTKATQYAEATTKISEGLDSELADLFVAHAQGGAAWRRGETRLAVTTLRYGLDVAVAKDVRGNLKFNLFMTLAGVLAGDPSAMNDASTFLSDSLRSFQADHYAAGIAAGLWAAGLFLGVTGQLEPAAILLVYSERNGFRPLLLATQQDRLESVIAAQPQHAEWQARGTRLTRDEAIQVAIEGLEG
jgi:predicted ATPase/class 3 adenylate cyclase